jgi:FKBP-type peptidyl-prolyl cis-trans isomerase
MYLVVLGCTFTTGVADGDDKAILKDQRAKLSYGLGLNVGDNLRRQSYDVDLEALTKGLKDSLGSGPTLLTEKEASEIVTAYQKELNEKFRKVAEKNQKEISAFLMENAKKTDVRVLPSGTQYKVLKDGSGAMPKQGDVATVHYRCRLVNGTEVDSSYKQSQPIAVPVDRFVRGIVKAWAEALPLMRVGSKWEIYAPSHMAHGNPDIDKKTEAATGLIYELELVSITPAP